MANTAKGKRINRHKLAVIQAYSIIALFVVFGIIAGFIWGRFTAPTKVETVTLTETVETPVYESDSLPAVSDVTYFDVPYSMILPDTKSIVRNTPSMRTIRLFSLSRMSSECIRNARTRICFCKGGVSYE